MAMRGDDSPLKLHKMWSVEDPWTKRKSQLILTDERLVFSRKKGKAKGYEPNLYIPLDLIAKAYSETTDDGDVILRLRLTNGEEKTIPLTYSRSMILLGHDLLSAELRLEAKSWVSAINTRLQKRPKRARSN